MLTAELDPLQIMLRLGEIGAELRNLKSEIMEHKEIVDDRFKSHGIRIGETAKGFQERLGQLEGRVLEHILQTNGNGNGWRQRVGYVGGGGIIGASLVELVKLLTQG